MTMSMATGAMGSLLPKLVELLKEEYKLKESVKDGVRSLEKEMKSMQGALRKVGEVPRDQLDEQVKIWAGEVRELSFNMEDVVDKFIVRADDSSESPSNSNKLKRLTKKMASLFTKGKARHEIADAIKDINKKAQYVANNRVRYNVDNIVASPAAVTPDPRLRALYTEVTELVGIAGKRDQDLMRLLSEGDTMSKKKLKIVSVVGFGGLGKTTLVKMVYETIKGDFDCSAFVPVGRNADAKKVFMDLLLDLGMDKNQSTLLDERQLIDKLRENLQNKRYLIVIDDIWDENLWRVIKCAFSNSNDLGSRLVTTTRIVSVSKSCSSSLNDSIYQMEPLSDDDSQSLFYKRIFSHESGGCPPEFKEVSIDILKKCGGVPLAIITIASLLASDQRVKPEDEWHVLLDSIGRGLTEDPSAEEMLRILSFSYYDLPSHLKTCLLYLSMFPEDHRIMKDQLIWMWIAESFVQCEKAKTSLFEIGEAYFNELVNRSLIQPLYNHYGIVYGCRVHDSVLDLICSLSSKENFVTVLNGIEDIMSSQSNVRRLSLQNGRKEEKQQTTSLKSMSILQVRSIAAFDSALMLPFPSFSVLRVLDMGGCNISGYKHLNLRDLGTLFNLRYLGLARTGISQVPEEIGKLQFLQVLDLTGNKGITELPQAVIRLRRLMCLLIRSKGVKFMGEGSRIPDGIGNLTSMEVLGDVYVDSLSKVKELGNLQRLRDLAIQFDDMSLELEEAFVESLGKMSNMESLEVMINGGYYLSMDLLMERWVPPRSLCRFIADQAIQFSKVPAWIRRNPSHMSHLFLLEIFVEEVQQEDMGFLGKLPALRSLVLLSSSQTSLLLGADDFRCLTSFHLYSESAGGIMFQPGALPKAEQVVFQVSLQATKEEAAETGGDWFDLGIGNLPSLRMVDVHLHVSGVTVWEARRVEAALRAHRTSGSIRSEFNPDIPEDAHDDEVCK